MSASNRMSMYSTTSSGPGLRNVGSPAQQSTQVSTTTLLNAVHTIYTSGQPYKLDASTSLVVNTWLTASQPDHDGRMGGAVDAALAQRAWEHARRRAEDGCIMLGYGISPTEELCANKVPGRCTPLHHLYSSRSSRQYHSAYPLHYTPPSTSFVLSITASLRKTHLPHDIRL